MPNHATLRAYETIEERWGVLGLGGVAWGSGTGAKEEKPSHGEREAKGTPVDTEGDTGAKGGFVPWTASQTNHLHVSIPRHAAGNSHPEGVRHTAVVRVRWRCFKQPRNGGAREEGRGERGEGGGAW